MRTWRLTGWVRLWLVCALFTWAWGTWETLTEIGVPPSADASASTVCTHAWRVAGYPENSAFVTDCPGDPRVLSVARQGYDAEANTYWTRVVMFALPWAVAPFLIAMAFGVAGWVLAGFWPTMPWAGKRR